MENPERNCRCEWNERTPLNTRICLFAPRDAARSDPLQHQASCQPGMPENPGSNARPEPQARSRVNSQFAALDRCYSPQEFRRGYGRVRTRKLLPLRNQGVLVRANDFVHASMRAEAAIPFE